MKRVLVTGGAGFLGSHLCDKLIKLGYFVICIDNLYTGCKKNISHLLKNSNFSFLEKDICMPFDIEVDEIYNMASPASPKHYQMDPIYTAKTNFLGSLNMLNLAKKNKAKIFQASTSEVYGDPKVHPQKEEYVGSVNPIGIRACYDESKRCAETLFFDFHRKYGVLVRVGRIFNTYGPRMVLEDGRVVSNFIVQALKKEAITIYGDGKQTRSFCFVDDLIDSILAFMEMKNDITGPINLGNPLEFTILELANKILKATGSTSKIVFEKLPLDDPKKRKPDITKAKNFLKWKPKISLDEGLKKTIFYFKKVLFSKVLF